MLVLLWERDERLTGWLVGPALTALFTTLQIAVPAPSSLLSSGLAIMSAFLVGGQAAGLASSAVSLGVVSWVVFHAWPLQERLPGRVSAELLSVLTTTAPLFILAWAFDSIRTAALRRARALRDRALSTSGFRDRLLTHLGGELAESSRRAVGALRKWATEQGEPRELRQAVESLDGFHRMAQALVAGDTGPVGPFDVGVELRQRLGHREATVNLTLPAHPLVLVTERHAMRRLLSDLVDQTRSEGRVNARWALRELGSGADHRGELTLSHQGLPLDEGALRASAVLLGAGVEVRHLGQQHDLRLELHGLPEERAAPPDLDDSSARRTMAVLLFPLQLGLAVGALYLGALPDAAVAALTTALLVLIALPGSPHPGRRPGLASAFALQLTFGVLALWQGSPLLLATVATVGASIILAYPGTSTMPVAVLTFTVQGAVGALLHWRQPSVTALWDVELLRAVMNVLVLGNLAHGFELGRQRTLHALELERQTLEATMHLQHGFITNLAHELRTPLNAVVTTAETARGPSAAEAQDAVLTLLSLVEELVHIVAGPTAPGPEHPGVLRVGQAVRDLVELSRPVGHERGIELLWVPPSFDPPVRTDATALRELLGAMIRDAVRSTGRGEVRVALDLVVEGAEVALRMEVLDARAVPLEASDANEALLVSLAQGRGGRLVAGSRAEQSGLRREFTCRLPLSSELPKLPSPGAAVRVLVVDDLPLNLSIAERLLQRLGAQVTTASSGVEAVTRVRSGEPFGLVLLDLQMPELDGFETARALRSLHFSRPIVGITASFAPGTVTACKAAGMDDCVPKPCRLADLSRLIAISAAE